jgi:hypothetical protein
MEGWMDEWMDVWMDEVWTEKISSSFIFHCIPIP